ncbi:MAG: ATP-binding protein [Flavobacterium sp.]|nr:ATP-binding protein [Candidatus Neoflavobacterium equi]
MDHKIVVIIGGPGSGKSTIIEYLTQKGYTCYPEISREVTLEAKKQGIEQLFLEKPLLFSEMLLEGRKKQYDNALNEASQIVFIDRGIPDVVAYMDFIGDSYPAFFSDACHQYKYDQIFILPPWKEIYVSDEARYETYEQAVLINKHLVETYEKYGYNLVEVPKDTVANRVSFILDHLEK